MKRIEKIVVLVMMLVALVVTPTMRAMGTEISYGPEDNYVSEEALDQDEIDADEEENSENLDSEDKPSAEDDETNEEKIIHGNEESQNTDDNTKSLIVNLSIAVESVEGELVADEETLKNAVEQVETNGTIILEGEIVLNEAITIPSGKNILITSSESNNFKIVSESGRHFIVNGSLNLQNIIISGNDKGGGILVSGGSLTMGNMASVVNCFSYSDGAGILVEIGGHLLVDGGAVENNFTSGTNSRGGGIALKDSSAEIVKGTIKNNKSYFGGGVYIGIRSTFVMNGGNVSNNLATGEYGGGVYVHVLSTFTMNEGEISGNEASFYQDSYGGGVYVGQAHYAAGDPTDWCNFVMNGGAIFDNKAASGGGVAATINGHFEMNGGKIYENTADSGGGVALLNASSKDGDVTFTMNAGEIYENEALSFFGGGLWVNSGTGSHSIDVTIGKQGGYSVDTHIFGNKAERHGGGIAITKGIGAVNFEMYITDLINNSCKSSGGAIYIDKDVNAYIEECLLDKNYAGIFGGGLFVDSNSTRLQSSHIVRNSSQKGGGMAVAANANVEISTSTFDGNMSTLDGGGIFVRVAGKIDLRSVGVKGNIAEGDGGGIYSENFSYSNPADKNAYDGIIIDALSVLNCNTAVASYYPPKNADEFTKINYAMTSISNGDDGWVHPLNNYDINYVDSRLSLYSVTYDGNGGNGSYELENIASGAEYTIMDAEYVGIDKDGYVLKSWNTKSDGSGENYPAGKKIAIEENILLYAQWKEYVPPAEEDVDDGEDNNSEVEDGGDKEPENENDVENENEDILKPENDDKKDAESPESPSKPSKDDSSDNLRPNSNLRPYYKGSGVVKTGDESPVILMTILLIYASIIVGLIVGMYIRNRRQHKKK